MVRQGWLQPVTLEGGPGLRADTKGGDPARRRRVPGLSHPRLPTGTGTGTCSSPSPASRSARERVRNGLAFLGYAPLADGTWLAARRNPEAEGCWPGRRDRAVVHGPRRRTPGPGRLGLGPRRARRRTSGSPEARAQLGGRPAHDRPRGVRRAQPAGPRVAQVPVHRPRAARGPAARGTGPGIVRRGCSTRPPRICCPRPVGTSTPAWAPAVK